MVYFFRIICYFSLILKFLLACETLGIDDLLNLDPASTTSVLTLFNMTRKVGSENSQLTRDIIKDFFKNQIPLRWDIQEVNFEQKGFNFTNLIATLPYYNDLSHNNNVFELESCMLNSTKKDVIFAVHYDTIFNLPNFVGAIDSAASMAILLYIAHSFSSFQTNLSKLRSHNLKIVFFDGEEAFDTWSSTDSLYGSKHMARNFSGPDVDLFVLLDLIGAKNTEKTNNYKIYNFDRSTEFAHSKLVDLENKLFENSENSIFDAKYVGDRVFIDDDHVPFKKLGIPCLHLFPLPIPSFWHSQEDDFSSLDINSIKRISEILLKFTEEILC